MATKEQTEILATPTVMLNGRILKIVPGSLKEEGGAPGKVRTVSAGGKSVALVHGVDMKEAMTALKFEVANTAENQEIVRTFHDDSSDGVASSIRVINDTVQRAYNDCFMTNKFTAEYSAEGNIPVEAMALYVP